MPNDEVCPSCGGEVTKEELKHWGPYAWGIAHQVFETFPCHSCREHATDGIRAMHDLTNHFLGKPLYDKENLLKVAETYQKVADEIRAAPAVAEQKDTKPAHIAQQEKYSPRFFVNRRQRFLEAMEK